MADNRSSCWSLTINNPSPSDYEEINLARQRGWKVEGQIEKGTEGTHHLQLMVRTPQVRFSAVKKMFSRAHIEPARNPTALANYVTKEDTRVGQLPTGSHKYPSLSKFWELIAIELNHGHEDWTADDKEAFHHPDLLDADAYDRNKVYLYNATYDYEINRDPLRALDDATETLIGRGYYVEHHAANPSTRSSFRKWWRSILYRAMETARQTDNAVDSVNVPVTTEHNNADDSTRSQTPQRILEGIVGSDDEIQGDSSSQESRSSGSEGSSDNC